ncbi:lipoprotein [Pseudomonas alkylphenolica]|uniref:Lipoprotein n=1 Tax=Pseudomonas alkylphenolica TaxID=237609 RepID=A0A077FD04_9PSED|nr:lipoprotein [Pseudomonas alkylphenolica]
MMPVVNLRARGSGADRLSAAGHVSRGFICGSGLVLIGLLITGCAGKVEPEVRTVRVEVPVQVPCRAPDIAVPPWAAAGLKRGDSLEVKVRALLAERRQRIGYEKLLETATAACR